MTDVHWSSVQNANLITCQTGSVSERVRIVETCHVISEADAMVMTEQDNDSAAEGGCVGGRATAAVHTSAN